MYKRVAVTAVALAVVLVAVAGGVLAYQWLNRSAYEEAVASMPASTLRATFTDWSQVREESGGAPRAGASSGEVDAFLDRAYDEDLISTSAVYASTYAMSRRYGFSPLDATWEMLGQSREGAVVAMRLPESADFAGIERNLRTLGYDAPADGAGTGGVWSGSVDLVAQIDDTLTPVFQNLVVLPDDGLVLLSDSASYVSAAADVVAGSADSLVDHTDGVGDLAGLAEQPVAAVLWASDFACEDLSMASADEEDRVTADQLVSSAGGVSPLSGLVIALGSNHGLRVAMRFESSDQAEENLRPRAELASGEAVGQGGSFGDRFRITTARQTGENVVLDLAPVGDPADATLLSDLSQGPVLFATC